MLSRNGVPPSPALLFAGSPALARNEKAGRRGALGNHRMTVTPCVFGIFRARGLPAWPAWGSCAAWSFYFVTPSTSAASGTGTTKAPKQTLRKGDAFREPPPGETPRLCFPYGNSGEPARMCDTSGQWGTHSPPGQGLPGAGSQVHEAQKALLPVSALQARELGFSQHMRETFLFSQERSEAGRKGTSSRSK